MKKSTLPVTRFTLPKGFCVDVITDGDEVSFWLGHKDCDIRELMFAASSAFAPEDRWEAMISEDIDDYTADFREAWLEE